VPGQTEFSNESLIAAVYSGYKYPADFYTETKPDGLYTYYAVHTISSESLRCADSLQQAVIWFTKENSTFSSQVVKTREDDSYFERIRVDKCWSINETLAPSFKHEVKREQLVGLLTPVTVESVETAVKYFISHNSHNFAGYTVLSISTIEENSSVRITVYVSALSFGDIAFTSDGVRVDRVTLKKQEFIIDK
jgi:hypothetical protein